MAAALAIAAPAGAGVADGVWDGPGAVDRIGRAAPAVVLAAETTGSPAAARRPFIVIHFDRDPVDFARPVYEALGEALRRRPGARFDVVAVSPLTPDAAAMAAAAEAAQSGAEEVFRSLLAMGLPPERLTLAAATSPAAVGSEVHIYVR